MTNEILAFTVGPHSHGQRLDRFLTLAMPETSLRAARRLIERGAVAVDARNRPGGCKLRQGQTVSVSRAAALDGQDGSPVPAGLRLVLEQGGYAAMFKPAGLNTVRLAGSDAPSLQDALAALLPGRDLLLANPPGPGHVRPGAGGLFPGATWSASGPSKPRRPWTSATWPWSAPECPRPPG